VARLRKLTTLRIEVDDAAVADMGFDRRTKVSAHLRNVSLADALRHVVRRQIHGDVLDWSVADGHILISTEKAIARHPIVRFYDVRDLLRYDDGLTDPRLQQQMATHFMQTPAAPPAATVSEAARSAELVKIVEDGVDQDSWADNGGIYNIFYLAGRLAITTSWQNHRAVRDLLAGMAFPEHAGDFPPRSTRSANQRVLPTPLSPALATALSKPLRSISFDRVPFESVVQAIAKKSHVDLRVDWDLTGPAGLGRDVPISWRTDDNATLGSVLEGLCGIGFNGVSLGYMAEDNTITISTREATDPQIECLVYDVRDLIPAVRTSPSANPAARKDEIDRLCSAIENTVSKDTWRDNGGSTGELQEWHGLLVITQTVANHRQVRALLQTLRSGH